MRLEVVVRSLNFPIEILCESGRVGVDALLHPVAFGLARFREPSVLQTEKQGQQTDHTDHNQN
jgi:hypothetical protein